ncbi:MAG: hypothetical protein WD425_00440, partial [Nitrospirales bacterium]
MMVSIGTTLKCWKIKKRMINGKTTKRKIFKKNSSPVASKGESRPSRTSFIKNIVNKSNHPFTPLYFGSSSNRVGQFYLRTPSG